MRKLAIVWLIIIFMAGCATLSAVKPWADRTPQEKAQAFMQFYNTQYQDTMYLATKGTPAQKVIAAQKKAILKELWPLIGLYDGYASSGIPVGPEVEPKIMELINRLGGSL